MATTVVAALFWIDHNLETRIASAGPKAYQATCFGEASSLYDPAVYLKPEFAIGSVTNVTSPVDRILFRRRVSVIFSGNATGEDHSVKLTGFEMDISVGLFGMSVRETRTSPSVTMWN